MGEGVGVKKCRKILMGAKSLKIYPCGCKICEKGTFKRLFLVKFEFSAFIIVKIVRILLLLVLSGPVKFYLYGYNFFLKQGDPKY